MAVEHQTAAQRRIYPLDPRKLTEEQLAVVFAMTSRSPDPFDVIAKRVTEEKAADFHERWVLNYGHASVAEHAVLHMAVENISRLVADDLEDNRLASYTELSSRYQVIGPGHYHVPKEMDGHPLREVFVSACDGLFEAYGAVTEGLREFLSHETPQREEESDKGHRLRIRRVATDSARFLLPAATVTNVGFTINARGMEHAITKLLSSGLMEEREIGQDLKEQGREITPTLIKYADYNEYLALTRSAQQDAAGPIKTHPPDQALGGVEAKLVHADPQAEQKLVAALLYRHSGEPYDVAWSRARDMGAEERERVVDEAMSRLGGHDIPVRELETVDYTFDLTMDYGAYREFKRHRMQTYIPQPLTVVHGYIVPPLVEGAGLKGRFQEAMSTAEEGFERVARELPDVARYLVTHAHNRRVLSKMNLRECYHLFKLRTQSQAHFTLREVVGQAMELTQKEHPLLFKYLQLRS